MNTSDPLLCRRGLAFIDAWNAPLSPQSPLSLDFSLLSIDSALRVLVAAAKHTDSQHPQRSLIEDLGCYLALLFERNFLVSRTSVVPGPQGLDVVLTCGRERYQLTALLSAFVTRVKSEMRARKRYAEFEWINEMRNELLAVCKPTWPLAGGRGALADEAERRSVHEYLDMFSESCAQWFQRTSPAVLPSHQSEIYRSVALALCARDGTELEQCLARSLETFMQLGYTRSDSAALAESWSLSANPVLALFAAVLLQLEAPDERKEELSAALLKRLGVPAAFARRLLARAREEFGIFEDWILADPSPHRARCYRSESAAGLLPQLFLPETLLTEARSQQEVRLLFHAIAEGNAERAQRLCILLTQRKDFLPWAIDLKLQAAYLSFVLGDRSAAYASLLQIRNYSAAGAGTQWRYFELRALLEQSLERPKRAICYYKKALRLKGIAPQERARLCTEYAELLARLGDSSAAAQLHTYSAYLRARPSIKGFIHLIASRMIRFGSAYEREVTDSCPQDAQVFLVLYAAFLERYAVSVETSAAAQDEQKEETLQAIGG